MSTVSGIWGQWALGRSREGCPARGKEAGKLLQRRGRLSWVSKAKEVFLSRKGVGCSRHRGPCVHGPGGLEAC